MEFGIGLAPVLIVEDNEAIRKTVPYRTPSDLDDNTMGIDRHRPHTVEAKAW